MEKNLHTSLDEVFVGSSDKKQNRHISTWLKKGQIRKIAPRLYSTNLKDDPKEIIRRNLFEVLALLYPGAILSHRSAFEFKPTVEGHIFMTHSYTKKVSLPGLTLRFLSGPGALDEDRYFTGQLRVSQEARAYLENLQTSRGIGPTSKNLPLPVLEEKLEKLIRVEGEEGANRLRDKARQVADELSMEHEFGQLDSLIGALLSTRDAGIIKTTQGAARAMGTPYDPDRVLLFQSLFRELEARPAPLLKDPNISLASFRTFAFYESYFSNYIEGTEFEVEEARQIIENNEPIPARDEDSHDIMGTYQLVSDRDGMAVLPHSSEAFISLLKERHRVLLRARPGKDPGLFKSRNNRAGNTVFVDWTLVEGTLVRAFEIYRSISHPFKRAAFMLFVVSEVHPFLDGNGRVARVMMNAELVAANQAKILIPTVYRDDYLGALRKLTRGTQVDPFFRMLRRAQDFSHTIRGDDMDKVQNYLENCLAFLEPTEGSLQF